MAVKKYEWIQQEIYYKDIKTKKAAVNEILTKELPNNNDLKRITIVDGKVYIDGEPAGIIEVVNNLDSDNPSLALSAKQGKILKQYIDNIMRVLSSNDTSLDELQELVDFIKQNREALKNLTIDSIAGLRVALDSKADKSQLHTHTNKNVLDALGSSDGELTYNGNPVNRTVEVYDGLDSDDEAKALSAKQGKVLNDTKADKDELHVHNNKDVLDGFNIKSRKLYWNDKRINHDVSIRNVLTSNSSRDALSARMGKVLNDTKADKSELHHHSNKDLLDLFSASNNRLFYDGKKVTLDLSIVDNLNSEDASSVLSAKQGKILNDTKADKSELHTHQNKSILDKISETSDGSLAYNGNPVDTKVDIYDGLDSNSSAKALSARQGKILNENKADKSELHNHDNKNVLDALSSVGSKLYFNGNPVDTRVEVYDGLDSTSTTKALSANKGKELEDKKADKAELPDMSQYVTKSRFNSEVNRLEDEINSNHAQLSYVDTVDDLLVPNGSAGDIVYVKKSKKLFVNIDKPVTDSDTGDVYQSYRGVSLPSLVAYTKIYLNIISKDEIINKLGNDNGFHSINEDLSASSKKSISDGGNDVYDNGNKIYVNNNQITYIQIPYSYLVDQRMLIFTFNLFQDDGITEIRFEGNNGADGGGNMYTVTNLSFSITTLNKTVVLNGRGIQNAGTDPYIRHLLITQDNIVNHTFANSTDNDNDVYTLNDGQPAILVVYWCENGNNNRPYTKEDFTESIKAVAKMLLGGE